MGELTAIAEQNRLNIGTADHLVGMMGSDAVKPGELINWIIRFDTTELDTRIAALEELVGSYSTAATDHALEDLEEDWEGKGSRAFSSRWAALSNYVGQNTSGRLDVLVGQLGAMKNLRQQIHDLYTQCGQDIDGILGQTRKRYVEALCETGDSATVASALANAGTGATLGSAAGPVGTAAGAAVGAVIDVVSDFISNQEQRLSSLLGEKTTVESLVQGWESSASSLKLSADSSEGLSLNFEPLHNRAPDNVGMNEEWKPA